VFFAAVSEQEIMDWQLTANRNGHVACTHGGETLAGLMAAKRCGMVGGGLMAAKRCGMVGGGDIAVLDSTAHALKFSGFQDMYFENRFPADLGITPNPALVNRPVYIRPADLSRVPAPGNPLAGEEFKRFVRRTAEDIAGRLNLKKTSR
jgi:threonine synthase